MSALKLTLALAALIAAQAAYGDDTSVKSNSGLAADLIVNGQPISQNHVTLMSANFSPDKTLPSPEAKSAARSELITEELLAQQARKEGVDKQPEVADQIAFQERAILSRAYLEDYFAKNPITEESLKSAYEWNRANGKIVEYKVRQILVPSADVAQQVIDKLNQGEDFAELARHYTQDPGGQNNGGDLNKFASDMGTTADDINNAAAAGSPIDLPIGPYQAKYAGTPLDQAIAQHIRFSPGGLSAHTTSMRAGGCSSARVRKVGRNGPPRTC